jgi:ATP-dependent helicase HepA
MSDAEPELGLGLVIDADERSVVLQFAAADETRRYAVRTAPLRRVRFDVGDVVTSRDGERIEIDAVDEHAGLLVYRSGDRSLAEAQVSDRVALTGPRERLLAGRADPPDLFDLRVETLERLHRLRKSPLRGFVGSRIELLPHQFFIASEVTSRRKPRVLLADETGLGKTIEACLILNRLLLTGRASRVLILVPDSLVHQWLVELRRRFNLPFAIFDEERCAAIETSAEVELVEGARDEELAVHDAGEAREADEVRGVRPNEAAGNPFDSEQLVLAGISLFSDSDRRSAQAAAAGWDVVVVDEAHHLVWEEGRPSAAYRAVERVAGGSDGLILLTATPEQLGEHSHFARLQLLDPDRYDSFEHWRSEAEHYREIARIADRLLRHETLSVAEHRRLAAALDTDVDEIDRRLAECAGRHHVIDELIDRHGPGRVMFRNTRAAMTAFPDRQVKLERLEAGRRDSRALDRIAAEVRADLCDAAFGAASETATAAATDFSDDPRIVSVTDFLTAPATRTHKLLVICHSAAKAQAVKAAIEARINVDVALFHERLTLLQRDRNAAWFAAGDGARVLVCSEIGSEGRNFQHAQHLVMFDLPLDPDLVEQRIGRLDRIGQRGSVHVLVPFVAGTGLEVLARWHDEGVGAFERPTLTALPLLERFGPRVRELALDAVGEDSSVLEPALVAVITETAAAARELAERVAVGRDRLLEMASLRRDVADPLVAAIAALDESDEIEDYFLRLLESFHIYAEELAPRTYRLNPDAMRSAEFPSLERGETAVAFDRDTALVREDLGLVTVDHPLLSDAMELLLASERGNASFAIADERGRSPRLILEVVFVLEPIAPARLHVDRFMPPTPVRVAVDQTGADLTGSGAMPGTAPLEEGRARWLAKHAAKLRPVLANMIASADEAARRSANGLRATAIAELHASLGAEIERLRALSKINDHVRPEEIAAVAEELTAVERHLTQARLRMDSARLVWQGPSFEGEPRPPRG